MVFNIKCFLMLVAAAIVGATVHVDRVEMCDKEDYPIMWFVKIKDDGNKQIVEEGFMDNKIDLNNDVLNKVIISQREGDKWNNILSKTAGICDLVENFIGDFAKGLENSAGLKQSCPYSKGKYSIKNYPLDFSTFKYKDFPPGAIKVRSEYFAKDDEKKLLSCFEFEFTLTP